MTMLRRVRVIALALGVALIAVCAGSERAAAFDKTSTSAVNVDEFGLALKGYDPVAYQATGKAVKGDAAVTADHGGATYQFSSAANRSLFIANPAKYVPAFGGFCAFGASLGKKFDADPEAFKVVDGRLYVHFDKGALERWSLDAGSHIKNANDTWPMIQDMAPGDL